MLHLTAPPLPVLLDAGEDTYELGQSHPNRHRIGVFDVLVVTKGTLFMQEGEQKYEVKSGYCLILYPDRHHFSYQPCEEETHFYWFHFVTPKEWKELKEPGHIQNMTEGEQSRNPFTEFPFGIVVPNFCLLHNRKVAEHLSKQIVKTGHELNNNWEWQRQILFQQLLNVLSEHAQLEKMMPSLAVAEQAAAYIRKNYRKKITYAALGEALSFHPNHIARCMISSFGFTPIEYLNRIRIDQAKLLLVSKDWSIEKVSENCGFSQMAYFSRLFKKQEGISPNEFRKKYIATAKNAN